MDGYLVKKSQIVAVLVFLIEIVGAVVLAQTNTTDGILEKVGRVAILYCVISTTALYYVKREWDIFLGFMIMSYLFSFGQCILAACGYKLGFFAFSMDRVFFSNKEILDASVFSFSAISLTGIGYYLYRKTDSYTRIKKQPKTNSHNLCRVAWGLLIISIIPTYYKLYKDMTTVFSVGYQSTLGNVSGIDKVCVLLSGFYTSALLILYCFEERRRNIVYLALGIYVLMQLLGGSRIEVFRLTVVLLIISYMFRKEINKKNIILIFLIAFGGMFVFSFVSSARNYIYLASNARLFLRKTENDLLEKNFIFSAIKEMGNTQVINTLVHSICPTRVEYRYGLSFIRAIYGIFPNILNLKYCFFSEREVAML